MNIFRVWNVRLFYSLNSTYSMINLNGFHLIPIYRYHEKKWVFFLKLDFFLKNPSRMNNIKKKIQKKIYIIITPINTCLMLIICIVAQLNKRVFIQAKLIIYCLLLCTNVCTLLLPQIAWIVNHALYVFYSTLHCKKRLNFFIWHFILSNSWNCTVTTKLCFIL